MRRRLIALVTLFLALDLIFAIFLIRSCQSDDSAPSKQASSPHPPAAAIQVPREELFERIFWQRVGSSKILKTDLQALGPDQTRYFLFIQADQSLIKRCWDENTFRLRPLADLKLPAGSPSWFSGFKTEEYEVRSTPGGEMTLIYLPKEAQIYATGTLQGFTPGASSPAESLPPAVPERSGRLPTHSPPTN